ncbi:hypothetical protein DCC81_23975 [Chitinophaga parva]|uniref:Uncharacterized protein n=1 Tax=Chitinophaga parva TaxID=2169414 RepID=A0A2T7BEI2_9BACT|nr:DUF5677 domain-containing protein [Chitinophaga parva]PUZ23440.1 hypothetical protein DCC81_23975 [Chitinophaga parva]
MNKIENKLINRELEPNIKSAYAYCSDRIDSLVDYSLGILKPELKITSNSLGDSGPIFIFRHILDLLDSISLLIRTGSSATPQLLLRALFESYVYLVYIAEKDTLRRQNAYVAFNSLENYIYDKKKGINTSDQRFIDATFLFSKQPYKEILENYENKNAEHWYSLFGGPTSFKKLLRYLKLEDLYYSKIYKDYSENVHGTNQSMRNLRPLPEGGIEFPPLRDYQYVGEIFGVAIMIACQSLTYFAEIRKLTNLGDILKVVNDYSNDYDFSD